MLKKMKKRLFYFFVCVFFVFLSPASKRTILILTVSVRLFICIVLSVYMTLTNTSEKRIVILKLNSYKKIPGVIYQTDESFNEKIKIKIDGIIANERSIADSETQCSYFETPSYV